jgi:hypothetical protein
MSMKTVHFRQWDCVIEKLKYGNGRPAIILNDGRTGEQVAVATVNLPNVEAGRNEVFIKNYSENEGMLDALQAAGVVRETGDYVACDFAIIPRCELLPPYRERTFGEQLKEQSPSRRMEPAGKDRGRDI